MNTEWMSLLPPLIVLFFGFWTQKVMLSLGLGIISASIIAAHFNLFEAAKLGLGYFWANAELTNLTSWNAFWHSSHLFIGFFLIILGTIVTLISHSGGAHAYGSFIKKYLNSKKGAESSSLILSSFLFVDDYFSSLTVGSVMHPITDMFKIPRVKLAFLVDAMAAPISIIAPISSWVPVILSQLSESGISLQPTEHTAILADPFIVYSGMVPFTLYSFLIVSSTWYLVRRNISFGAMKRDEEIAELTGNLFGGKQRHNQGIKSFDASKQHTTSMIDFLAPILMLFVLVIGFILYSGGYYRLGGSRSLLESFQNTKADYALFMGGLIALSLTFILFTIRGKIKALDIPSYLLTGTQVMAPAMIILLLSWTLGDLLRQDLHTGHYLAKILVGSVTITFFPLMFFITAAITSFATGSSWGTIAIIFPIAIPMLTSFLKIQTPAPLEAVPLLFPLLGAIASGAVFGDHISPISDTTIMASTSTGSHHIDHVRTQMTYAIPVFVATGLSFLLAGFLADKLSFWANASICAISGILCSFMILELLHRREAKKSLKK